MSSLMGSLLALAAAVCATVLAAAAHQPPLHMAVAGVAGLALTFMAIRDRQRLMFAGATTSAVASSTARHLGIVWAWAALAVAATYLLIIEARWPEWWQFFIGFAFAAIASFVFASMLDRDRSRRSRRRYARQIRQASGASADRRHGGRDHQPVRRRQISPRREPRRLGRLQYLLFWCTGHRRHQSRRFTISGARVMQWRTASV